MESEYLPDLCHREIDKREFTDRSSAFVADPVDGRPEKIAVVLVVVHGDRQTVRLPPDVMITRAGKQDVMVTVKKGDGQHQCNK